MENNLVRSFLQSMSGTFSVTRSIAQNLSESTPLVNKRASPPFVRHVYRFLTTKERNYENTKRFVWGKVFFEISYFRVFVVPYRLDMLDNKLQLPNRINSRGRLFYNRDAQRESICFSNRSKATDASASSLITAEAPDFSSACALA